MGTRSRVIEYELCKKTMYYMQSQTCVSSNQQQQFCHKMIFKFYISKVHDLCSCYTPFSGPFNQGFRDDAVRLFRRLEGLLNHLKWRLNQQVA